MFEQRGELVDHAFHFAVEAHREQKRKDFPLPYSSHVIEVYKRVFGYGVRDEEILAAALLHDIIEDTDYDFDYLKSQYGLRVASIVKECSRSGGDHVSNKEKLLFMKSFEKKSIESVIIKIADRYCNVMDYHQARRPIYAAWYALQAYPLYDRWTTCPVECSNMGVVFSSEDIINLRSKYLLQYPKLKQLQYANQNREEYLKKADKILMSRPRE